MSRAPNVLLLTVDALRADRTTIYGCERPTTPTLERLAREALVCDRAFSLGPFTQSACVQLFTSTRPLAYGGYDAGATGRPDTIFRHFNAAGYRTVALSTLHWVNRFFGYGPGLDEEYQLFIPNTLIGVAIANMRNFLYAYREGTLDRTQTVAHVRPVVEKLFADADIYCQLRIEHAAEHAADYPDSLLVNERYDFSRVRRVIARHKAAFASDPDEYVDRHLRAVPQPHEWLAADWRFCRTPSKLIDEIAQRLLNRMIGLFDPALASARTHRFRQYVDAGSLADKAIRLLRAEHDRPFFLWVHFMDTHIPFVSGRGRRWYRETPDYLAALGYPRDCDAAFNFRSERPSDSEGQRALRPIYDAAVRWTDEQIGRIVDALDESGQGENTVVAVGGDHGEELGDHGDVGHYFLFYEHSVRVPMLYRHKGMAGRRIDSLITSLDLAPTLAELCGLPPAAGWEGVPVTSAAAARRETVVMETFYGGNCVFAHRPIYLGVRSKRHKFLWKEYRDPRDGFSPDEPELFDLEIDPEERTNIYRPNHPALPPLIAAAAERLADMPEISDERVLAAFGEVGRAALRSRRPALGHDRSVAG